MKRLSEYPDVLNVKDIKEYLNICNDKAYELVHSGQFHIVKVGRRILIYKKVFQDWLEGNIS
ncbi:helix-turn-helix domain-containing protein [Cytobacillus firmus]|uniref:Helix-turn-helix domain-containing protein n=1 Tax=Cytobacillus firmus TaxID=1399 RepID=A0A800MS72_CYTFI|nr:helix-turn-helix domain-containing protein [Cytobacillus firmus]KAF0821509.1 hypothetical protein KIS1582_4752 [Cytobacillus firmus]